MRQQVAGLPDAKQEMIELREAVAKEESDFEELMNTRREEILELERHIRDLEETRRTLRSIADPGPSQREQEIDKEIHAIQEDVVSLRMTGSPNGILLPEGFINKRQEDSPEFIELADATKELAKLRKTGDERLSHVHERRRWLAARIEELKSIVESEKRMYEKGVEVAALRAMLPPLNEEKQRLHDQRIREAETGVTAE